MRLRLGLIVTTLLFLTFGFSQSAPKPLSSKPPTNSTGSALKGTPVTEPQASAAAAPNDYVIRLKNACVLPSGQTPTRTLSVGGCHNAITRAQFEGLANALYPEMTPPMRRSFAVTLARLMMYANAGEKAGIEKSPEYQQLLQFSHMQVAAQLMSRRLQKQASEVSAAEIRKQYDSNRPNYEEMTLQRIIVPKAVASTEHPVDEAAEEAFAEDIRKRWAAGEDPEKLQKEAFAHSRTTMTPPPVDLGIRRRGGLPMTQAAVFDLKPGDISQPFADTSGYFIFKVVKRETAPFSSVEAEIRQQLISTNAQAIAEKVANPATVELNESYFGGRPPKEPPVESPGQTSPRVTKPVAPDRPAPNPQPEVQKPN